MEKEDIDNTVSYGTKSGKKFLVFLMTMLISGLGVITYFDTYFTDFWKIKECRAHGYELNQFMTSCRNIESDRYAHGVVYMGIQKEAVKSAKSADVIIFGNSRTMRSFSAPSIKKMFDEKGLSFMVLASEGAGFRSAMLTTEKLKLKPKILLVNNEIHYFDNITEGFREIVDFPEKYETRFRFFYNAQQLQKRVCTSNFERLKKFYCEGRISSIWRSIETGQANYVIVGKKEQQELIVPPKTERAFKKKHIQNARELFGMKNFNESCRVLYLVNNPGAAPKLQNRVADKIGAHAVYTEMKGLYTYDTSHMDSVYSEIWAQEFVKDLGPVLDKCIRDPSPLSEEYADLSGEYQDMTTAPNNEFELWNTRSEMTLTNKAAMAPDGKQTADNLTWTKRGSRLFTTFPDTPIKAGTTFRFSGWAWAAQDTRVAITAVKSCDRETPPESSRIIVNTTPEPQKFTLEHTFEHDQKCVLIQITGLTEDGSINIWNGFVEYENPFAEEN